jgi:hypothetical protein
VANETFLDASGATKYRKSTGAGSVGDPAVAHNIIDGTVTVTGAGGTFPVTDNGGSLTVDGTVAATQSGTWTVQPGNTANTTAWLVTGTGGTFPVTGTITANIGTIGTLASEANVTIISSASVTPASTPVGNRVLLIGGLDSGVARVANIDTAGNFQVDIVSSATLTVTGTGGTFPVTDSGGSLTVDNGGTFAVQAAQSGTWNITNVSGTVSLPTGAATAAKQPALGTAGTASADVISVQGIASMTASISVVPAAVTACTHMLKPI